ncbi:STAS-like domain-containing protein [Methylococcus mesophilus]|uniref:STAS-like domain-containing protein n=1 Tax=Methylococcus mesophilus TaxID=2993564 RepID=UPI00224AD53C|nr:STAS-like domain-containing protein [Methylococcus mesophilus]UZR29053.1 STAS-like domain-containing protein [Methylococcus mesophilus]
MSNTIINIAKQFSRYPAGRLKDDGPFSGERFREEFLEPVLRSDGHAVVEFDGARGYGSSFLEEAFGGLVRLGYPREKIKQAFSLLSSDRSLIDEINDYIEHGTPQIQH